MYFERSAHSVVSNVTSNKYLQACLTYSWGDYGSSPKNSTFFISAIVNDHFIKEGGFYPCNGPAMIPYCLAKTVLKNGGNFYTKAMVDRVLLRKNKQNKLEAYGVEVLAGKDSKIQFHAPIIISGTGLFSTFQ